MSKELILAACIVALAPAAMAAEPAHAPATSTQTQQVTILATDADSGDTREALRTLLGRYPPEVGMVLKLDPTLMGNASYLANYPALADFLGRHPEVAHSPASFLESVQGLRDRPAPSIWREMMGDIGGFFAFLIVMYILVWMIKTLIEYRRWSRLSRVQTEVHSKLLDRFTSNEELIAYVQSPAGRRFLESAPISMDAGPRPMSAPVGRMFGSLQAGLVLLAAGIGLDVASFRFPTGASEPMFAIAVIAICVGLALVLSAIVFYALSRRMGLWQPPELTAAG